MTVVLHADNIGLQWPNFLLCDKYYGENLNSQECFQAIQGLPQGQTRVRYGPRGIPDEYFRYNLPMQKGSGDCYVTIEATGATPIPGVFAKPDDLRDVALMIFDQCVQRGAGGGFGTIDFQNMISWNRENPQTAESWRARPPVSASFLTVTITGPRGKSTLPSPGNLDPAVPIAVAKATYTTAEEMARFPALTASSTYWVEQANQMKRGGTQTWWQLQPPKAPQMTYKCDANLGRPPVVDCTQIEWNQLSPSSDILNVGPGVTFLHSNSCYLAISVTAALVLTWEQIRMAVATLMNVCIHTPYLAPQGGSAYWTSPAKRTSGRKKKKKRRQSHNLTGLNALPPHVNITIFEQREAWKSPSDELKSCTWQAVAHGNPIKTCVTT